jgi:hypothetical protein
MATYNSANTTYQSGNKTLFEVQMLATPNGQVVSNTNPLPVTLGSSNVNITANGSINVNVPNTIIVNSSPLEPVHVHITEIGNSGLLQDLNISYMPILGNVNIRHSNSANITASVPLPVTGNLIISTISSNVTVSINNFPTTQNVSFANQSVTITGNIAAITANVVVSVNNFPTTQNSVIFHSNGANITNSVPLPVTAAITGTITTTPVVGAVDAFGRARVSSPLTLFDSSHRYRDNNLWSTSNTAGGTYVFSNNEGLINLNLTTANNAEIIRETTKVFSYQPGKSLQILQTFVMQPKTNVRQRVGYYGANNGIYLEVADNTAYLVERSLSSGVMQETRVAQSSWNVDTLLGAVSPNPSGITLDLTKAQIMFIDIEWLGLGTVRCGFVINGNLIYCHSFHHANFITSTYMTTASLPLRYEIKNTGVTASNTTLKQVCSTVISEGGYELRGLQQAIGTVIGAPRDLTTVNTYYPVVSIRLKASPDRLDAIVILTALSILGITNNANYNWRVVASGTTTGGTWTTAGDDSAVEYNITGTSFAGGRILASGWTTGSNQGSSPVDILKEALFKFQLERNGLTSSPYELTVVAAADTGGADIYASMDWEEISR